MRHVSNTPSTQWALRYIGNVSLKVPTGLKALINGFRWKNLLGGGPSVTAALLELKNLSTGDSGTLAFTGAGVQVGFGRTAASLSPDWVTFHTTRPYSFADFEGAARLGSLGLALGVGYGEGFIVFSGIDVDQSWWNGESIDISGPIGGTNVAIAYYPLGTVTLVEDSQLADPDTVLPQGVDTQAPDLHDGLLQPPPTSVFSPAGDDAPPVTAAAEQTDRPVDGEQLSLPSEMTQPVCVDPSHPSSEQPNELPPAEMCWQPQAGYGGNAPGSAPSTGHAQQGYDPMGDMVGPDGGS